MNESIGAKGVGRDFRRTLIIKQKEKDKLKEFNEKQKLKKLEQEVRKKQIYTLIKTLPIAIAYETIKDVLPKKQSTEPKKEEKDSFIEEKQEKQQDYIEVVIVLEDGTKKTIKVAKEKLEKLNKKENELEIPNKNEKEQEKTKEEIKEPILEEKQVINKPKGIGEETVELIEEQQKIEEPVKSESKKVEEQVKSEGKKIEDFNDLTVSQQEKLNKLKSRKIIDVYGKQLKDIRYELRQLIFEYNTLVSQSEDMVESKEAEEILDKLSVIIEKLERLKDKINIENLDKYDDNYIYTLVEEYLEEFKDKKVISDIKDSKLYISISNKLDELDRKKDSFKKEVEEEKDKMELKEEALDKLKEKYYNIDKVNKDLEDFQYQQEIILRELRQKIDNATTVRERTEVQIEAMNRETRRMLRRLTLAMMIPGIRPVRAMATTAALYAQFMRNIINPRTVTRKYKVITVEDYSSSIEANIKEIDKASSVLNKTEKEIDKMIKLIKYEFSEYIGVIKECDELLANLDKVKGELHEKEYEIEKIKTKQEKELERNNAKVLAIGEYPM